MSKEPERDQGKPGVGLNESDDLRSDSEENLGKRETHLQHDPEVESPKMGRKTSKKELIVIILLITLSIVVIAYRVVINGGFWYFSTDFKNDEEIENSLVNYLNEKYGINSRLELESKELEAFCTFWLDTCFNYAKNYNIYAYRYSGFDENNNKFSLNYTNGYVGKGIHKPEINDNYYIYDNVRKIQDIVKNYYDVSDIYFQMGEDSYWGYYTNETSTDIVVRIYDEEHNPGLLSKINDDILEVTDWFKIVYTNDRETYDTILASKDDLFTDSSSWQEPNVLSKDLNYFLMKYKSTASSPSFSSVKFDDSEVAYTIVLTNHESYSSSDTDYYIYQKTSF